MSIEGDDGRKAFPVEVRERKIDIRSKHIPFCSGFALFRGFVWENGLIVGASEKTGSRRVYDSEICGKCHSCGALIKKQRERKSMTI